MHPFDFSPAHAQKPCIRAHGGSVIFSAVFRNEGEHGLQLIHIPDRKTFYIPLTEEYRVGCVYSVKIRPFEAQDWLYRYRSGDHWVLDPHARGVQKILLSPETGAIDGAKASSVGTDPADKDIFSSEEGSQVPVTACSCAPPYAENLLEDGPERPLPPADWSREIIYGLHVKGLTAALPDTFPGRGTFAGVTAMIPYLRELGVTAVELMPVYQPLPDHSGKRSFRTMQEALGAWPVGPQGDPLRDMKERPNYWGFGRGLYYALRPEYGTPKMFAQMVRSLHRAGIRVLMQVYFERGIQPVEQIDLLRFYVDRYGIDGFRLLGHLRSVEAIASAPALADTALLYHDFPFDHLREAIEEEKILLNDDLDSLFPDTSFTDLQDEAGEEGREGDSAGNPARPAPRRVPAASHDPVRFPYLLTCGEDYQTLLRRFVKSDDYVLKDFLKYFLTSPEDHGELRSVTSYEGFTLADLVSYSERHNEANGELGLDGRADNYSWNCGEEGDTEDEQILALRRRQMRNFLTLLFLSRGTPLLRQGDERCNSQRGNNNPYCQDNEISWVDWTPSPDADRLTEFTSRLIAFRKDHPVFYQKTPFHYIDTLGIGHPDVSLHGEEAWKPDLGSFSHSIGIAYCEEYSSDLRHHKVRARKAAGTGYRPKPAFLYIGINMYWKDLSLALPKLPANCVWKGCMDTAAEEGFLDTHVLPADQHYVRVPARSIRILRSVPDIDAIVREKREERLADLPAPGTFLRSMKKRMHSDARSAARRLCGRTPKAARRSMRLYGLRHK